MPSCSDESDLEEIVEKIFDCMNDLYIQVSARHFVLIDAPPLELSPAGQLYPYILIIQC